MTTPQKMTLTTKVLLAMGLGIVVGLFINLTGLNAEETFIHTYIVNGLFFLMGSLFIKGLVMLVVPLVFFSLTTGVVGIGDIRALGTIGGKSFIFYIFTTALAIASSITIAATIGIGEGLGMTSTATFSTEEIPPLSTVFTNIIPDNILSAMAAGNMLQIIFFSILLGISILMVGKTAEPAVRLLEIGNAIMMKMVTIVMLAAPYAIFGLLAQAVSTLGLSLLLSLASYVGVMIAALLLHLFFTLMVVLKLFSDMQPSIFLSKIREVQIFAFSTSSSNATIPISINTAINKLGVKNSVASFVIPFGATINMDGTAIMQGVATVFIANAYGVELGMSGYLTVILMSILASIGTAGVPGVGLVMLSMIFTQLGLPVEGIGLILGVDRLLDMIRTAVNVTGDSVVSVVVAKSEGMLDTQVYTDVNAGLGTDEITHAS